MDIVGGQIFVENNAYCGLRERYLFTRTAIPWYYNLGTETPPHIQQCKFRLCGYVLEQSKLAKTYGFLGTSLSAASFAQKTIPPGEDRIDLSRYKVPR